MKAYNFTFWDAPHPMVEKYYLMNRPEVLLAVLGGYVAISSDFGKVLMARRKALDLKKCCFVYNILMSAASLGFSLSSIYFGYIGENGYNLFCQELNTSDYSAENALRLNFAYFYGIKRSLQLLDTLFLVARKRFSKITWMQVIHHGGSLFILWVFGHNGILAQFFLYITLNSFEHFVLYGYFAITAYVTLHEKWKRRLCLLQSVVMFTLAFHASIPMFVDCGFPSFLSCVAVAGLMYFGLAFLRNYIHFCRKDIEIEIVIK